MGCICLGVYRGFIGFIGFIRRYYPNNGKSHGKENWKYKGNCNYIGGYTVATSPGRPKLIPSQLWYYGIPRSCRVWGLALLSGFRGLG